MEKYCPNCGREYDEIKLSCCPVCFLDLVEISGKFISEDIRQKVLIRDNFSCVNCGATKDETFLDIYHIVPIQEGGSDEEYNLHTLCKKCKLSSFNFVEDIYAEIDFDSFFVENDILEKRRLFDYLFYELNSFEFSLFYHTIRTGMFFLFKREFPDDYDGFFVPEKNKKDFIKIILNVKSISEIEQSIEKTFDIIEYVDYLFENYDEVFISKIMKGLKSYDNTIFSFYKIIAILRIESIQNRVERLEKKLELISEINDNYDEKFINRLMSEYPVKPTEELTSKISKIEFLVEMESDYIKSQIKNLENRMEYAKELKNSLDDDTLERLCEINEVPKRYKNRNSRFEYMIKNHVNIPKSLDKINEENRKMEFIDSFDDDTFNMLCEIREVPSECIDKEDKIKYLISNFQMKQIESTINKINYGVELRNSLDDETLGRLCEILEVPEGYEDRNSRIDYLIMNNIDIKRGFKKIKKQNIRIDFLNSIDDDIFSWLCEILEVPTEFSKENKIKYLLSNYTMKKIKSTIQKIEYMKKIENSLDDYTLSRLCEILDVPIEYVDKKSCMGYLMANFPLSKIKSTLKKVKDK